MSEYGVFILQNELSMTLRGATLRRDVGEPKQTFGTSPAQKSAMSNEALLDKLVKDCRAELDAIVSVLDRLRSGQLRITSTSEDIKRYEERAANLRKTIRQLRAHKFAQGALAK